MGKANSETPEKTWKDMERYGSSRKDMERSENIWKDKETHGKTLEAMKIFGKAWNWEGLEIEIRVQRNTKGFQMPFYPSYSCPDILKFSLNKV